MPSRLDRKDILASVILFAAYVVVTVSASSALPFADLRPGIAIAAAALFFRGTALVPATMLSAIASETIISGVGSAMLLDAAADIAAAFACAFLMRRWKLDPIFRRDRDVFRLLGASAIAALIWPVALVIDRMWTLPPGIVALHAYVAMFSQLLILVPFLLRWIAKPAFVRPMREMIETGAIFIALISVLSARFLLGIDESLSVPMRYLAFFPLMIIALRLRPRFVTLALVVTAAFAFAGAMLDASLATEDAVFRMEMTLSISAIVFLIITGLEEHRRANANKLQSQVETLENAVTKISSESKAKNDFIAILGHELRNPLTPVLSGIDILKMKPAQDKEEQELLQTMEASMLTVRGILNDLLDVSRISEGKLTLDIKRVNLEEILKRSLLSTEHHRKERHQNLVFRIEAPDLEVMGDAVRLEQIFSNLLTNASKYSNSGDTVTVRLFRRGADAAVEVADEGLGIDPSEIESIFLPFRQIDHGKRTKEGLGIGLSLVSNFAQMHGGKVSAASDGRGKGSRFAVTIPIAS